MIEPARGGSLSTSEESANIGGVEVLGSYFREREQFQGKIRRHLVEKELLAVSTTSNALLWSHIAALLQLQQHEEHTNCRSPDILRVVRHTAYDDTTNRAMELQLRESCVQVAVAGEAVEKALREAFEPLMASPDLAKNKACVKIDFFNNAVWIKAVRGSAVGLFLQVGKTLVLLQHQAPIGQCC